MKFLSSFFLFVHVITILGAAMSAENKDGINSAQSTGKGNQGGSEETSEKQGRRKLASTRGFQKQGKSGQSKGGESSNQPQNQPEQKS